MSLNFQIDELVWAKVDGYPWWPGCIKSIASKDRYEVMFFDDFSRAFLAPDKITDFEDASLKKFKNKPMYRKAID